MVLCQGSSDQDQVLTQVLSKAISRKNLEKLISDFGENILPETWSAANKKLPHSKKTAEENFPMIGGPDFVMISLCQKVALLLGA